MGNKNFFGKSPTSNEMVNGDMRQQKTVSSATILEATTAKNGHDLINNEWPQQQ